VVAGSSPAWDYFFARPVIFHTLARALAGAAGCLVVRLLLFFARPVICLFNSCALTHALAPLAGSVA
jgi:hypothetical protein